MRLRTKSNWRWPFLLIEFNQIDTVFFSSEEILWWLLLHPLWTAKLKYKSCFLRSFIRWNPPMSRWCYKTFRTIGWKFFWSFNRRLLAFPSPSILILLFRVDCWNWQCLATKVDKFNPVVCSIHYHYDLWVDPCLILDRMKRIVSLSSL